MYCLQTSYQRDTRNESWVYDYLVDSVKAPPAQGLLQVGDLIQSVNREPMQQRSVSRLFFVCMRDTCSFIVHKRQHPNKSLRYTFHENAFCCGTSGQRYNTHKFRRPIFLRLVFLFWIPSFIKIRQDVYKSKLACRFEKLPR